jgi:hypothetical protein
MKTPSQNRHTWRTDFSLPRVWPFFANSGLHVALHLSWCDTSILIFYRASHIGPMGMKQSFWIAMQAASAHARQSAYLPITGGS